MQIGNVGLVQYKKLHFHKEIRANDPSRLKLFILESNGTQYGANNEDINAKLDVQCSILILLVY